MSPENPVPLLSTKSQIQVGAKGEKRISRVQKTTKRLPRYTSYPTALEFKELSEGTHQKWLNTLPKNDPVSLYFHIPFCEKMCWFCGCFTKITRQYDAVSDYLTSLLAEIDLIGDWTGRREVSHIHFGGGSPSILTPEDFERLTAKIRQLYDLSHIDEYAVEIDPRTLSEEMVKSYVKSGVNRVSLGIQDYDLKVQEVINRVQPMELIQDNLKWLRDHGLTNINFDLIYGLPYQTVQSIRTNVLKTIELQPSRVALFGYAHVPWMKSHMTMLDEHPMAAPVERGEMFETAREAFLANGYEEVGLDHFALPEDTLLKAKKEGTLKRNFQGYSVDRADTMIGFGASSISKLDGGYVQNAPSLHSYPLKIAEGLSPVVRGIAISADDRMFYDIISDLMCYGKIDPWAVAKTHSSDYNFAQEEKMLDQLVGAGYMSRKKTSFKIESEGRHYLRAIATIFDQYFPQKESNILTRCVHESEG